MLLASNGKKVGGMEKQVALQANGLAEMQGFEVFVAADQNYAALFSSNCHFIPLKAGLGRRNPALILSLIRIFRRHMPEIIHAHGHKACELLATTKVFSGTGIRVATAHGTKRKNTCFATVHQAFAVSQGVQQALDPIPSVVIGNAVPKYDGETLDKSAICKQFNLDPSQALLLAAGRLVPVKRYDLMMHAISMIKCNLIVFGSGPEQDKLKTLQTPSVKLGGHIEHVQKVLPAADALIITSSREGFSLTMIEALQMGIPVISTPVSGAKDILPASAILETSTSDSLAKEIDAKLGQIDSLRRESRPSFALARDECSPEKLVERLAQQYHSLLGY